MTVTQPFTFQKHSATENDFLIASLMTDAERLCWSKQFGSVPRSRLAQALCDRFNGLGADGLVILEPSQQADYKWDFYNKDGSTAEMCGNAARAVTQWAARQRPQQSEFSFATRAGLVRGRPCGSGLFEITMTACQSLGEFSHPWLKNELQVRAVNSGVPHAVVALTDSHHLQKRTELRDLALSLRHHNYFGAGGANVTFYAPIGNDHIQTLTFERGVEDFTRACGTGAVAAAFCFHNQGHKSKVHVSVPGGELSIQLESSTPHLIGPSLFIADMTANIGKEGIQIV